MAKGYWIARIDVLDAEAYQGYIQANAVPIAKYGGRFIVRGGTSETREGTSRSRTVAIEFPDYQAALDCYDSPEYGHAKSLRENASDSDIIIIEGYDGPQPGDG
jgi:uncharacterized protein (DUF1330 family)